jgi:hypothetical protein
MYFGNINMFFYCLQSMFSNRKAIRISCINSCNHRPTKLLSGEIKLISITQTQAGGCVQQPDRELDQQTRLYFYYLCIFCKFIQHNLQSLDVWCVCVLCLLYALRYFSPIKYDGSRRIVLFTRKASSTYQHRRN